jgi:hypothetical protein
MIHPAQVKVILELHSLEEMLRRYCPWRRNMQSRKVQAEEKDKTL